MKLSTKGRYAVMAMADLAYYSKGNPLALSEIAERQEISLSYLEQLFAKLRRAGLVESTRGPGGGYLLGSALVDTRISDIIMAVDEPIKATRCQTGSTRGCQSRVSGRCLTHNLWQGLGDQIYNYLSTVTLADLCGKTASDKFAMFAGEEAVAS